MKIFFKSFIKMKLGIFFKKKDVNYNVCDLFFNQSL